MKAIFDTEWASLIKNERRLIWSIGNWVSMHISEKLD